MFTYSYLIECALFPIYDVFYMVGIIILKTYATSLITQIREFSN